MSTAIAERPAIPADELDLVRRTVANGATDAELKLFLFDCARRGVHPLDKLLHFTKRGGKYTPVTSIDFMRSQAAMSGEMAGSDDPTFAIEGFNEKERIVSATVTVYRITQGQRFAYTATARWSEYCPDNAPMWKRMPHTMLGKCAEALALRKAFPQQLAGLYSREEMDQADKAGFVVEAPASTAIPAAREGEREKPSSPNGGDSGIHSPDKDGYADPIVEDEPVIDANLPADARRVVKVEAGVAGSKGRITFDRPIGEVGKKDYLTWIEQVVGLATEVCQTREPVIPKMKVSTSGNWRIEGLARVPKVERPSTAPLDVPIDVSEIPF